MESDAWGPFGASNAWYDLCDTVVTVEFVADVLVPTRRQNICNNYDYVSHGPSAMMWNFVCCFTQIRKPIMEIISSYLHNGISCTGQTASLYYIRPHGTVSIFGYYFNSTGIPMIKIGRSTVSQPSYIYNWNIYTWMTFYIETGPWSRPVCGQLLIICATWLHIELTCAV